jgi:hypothetical protein
MRGECVQFLVNSNNYIPVVAQLLDLNSTIFKTIEPFQQSLKVARSEMIPRHPDSLIQDHRYMLFK